MSKIDVIIPVHNGEKFLYQTVKSVFGQSLQPERIIIINDASTDNSELLIKKLIAESNKITYIKLKENLGPSGARNVGLEKSQNDFVAFLDADDIWNKDKLKLQLETFKQSKYPNLGVVYSDYVMIDQDNRLLDDKSYVLDATVKGNVFEALLEGNKIAGSNSSVLIKKVCFDTVGIYDTKYPIGACEDWDMWIRLAEKYDFDFVPQPLVRIRKINGSASSDVRRYYDGVIILLNKWVKSTRQNRRILTIWRHRLVLPILLNSLRDLPNISRLKTVLSQMSPELKHYLLWGK